MFRRPLLSAACLLALLISFIGCRQHASDCPEYGYCAFKQDYTKDSTEAVRSRIRAIPAEEFEAYTYQGRDTPQIPYRLLRPPTILPGKKYPMVLLFHSSGTPIGNDNKSQLAVPAKYWAQPEIRKNYPAFVLAPQFAKRSSNYGPDSSQQVNGGPQITASGPGILSSKPDPSVSLVLQLIDSLKQILPIDPQRIYVMGFSMGGSTTINAIGLRPGLFAAAVSLSGIPDFDHLESLANTPLWLVHGNADKENAIASDSVLYKRLIEKGGQQCRFWTIGKMGHEIYGGLLKGDEIPKWLFAKHKQ